MTVYTGGLFIAAFVSIPIVNLATPLFAMALMVHVHKRLSREKLEHVTARLNRRDSKGRVDERVYRHWFAFGSGKDAEGIFSGISRTCDRAGGKWCIAA
jgi:hypothetical protein